MFAVILNVVLLDIHNDIISKGGTEITFFHLPPAVLSRFSRGKNKKTCYQDSNNTVRIRHWHTALIGNTNSTRDIQCWQTSQEPPVKLGVVPPHRRHICSQFLQPSHTFHNSSNGCRLPGNVFPDSTLWYKYLVWDTFCGCHNKIRSRAFPAPPEEERLRFVAIRARKMCDFGRYLNSAIKSNDITYKKC